MRWGGVCVNIYLQLIHTFQAKYYQLITLASSSYQIIRNESLRLSAPFGFSTWSKLLSTTEDTELLYQPDKLCNQHYMENVFERHLVPKQHRAIEYPQRH